MSSILIGVGLLYKGFYFDSLH